MNIKVKLLALAVISSFFFFSCSKKDDNTGTISLQDRTFIGQASASNTAEIQAAQLATSMTDSSAIKTFAQMMIDDHTTAQNDLKSLGTNINVPVTDSIDDMHQKMIDSLKTMPERTFDSVYILRQIADHQAAIANFQQEVNAGKKSDVIDYANKYLPKLQMHLQMADSLATALHYQ